MKLAGRVALVTGGGSGLGEASAQLMATEGAAVVIADSDARAGQHVVDAITAGGGESIYVSVDVANAASVEGMIQSALTRYGQLDVLLTSAGVFSPGSVIETTEAEWDRHLNINLKGTFLCAQQALLPMLKQGRGTIITLGSVAGLHAIARNAAYGPSKAGVVYLTQLLALEYGANGVRANCVCPGNIETPMLLRSIADETDPEQVLYKAQHASILGRLGRPEEVAQAIVFLASDEAAYITGATIVIDGGRLLKLA
jgi:NAD(P)-dependent dehydrogenase (short-subunit alcohol dehydrogenase family)